MRITTTLNLFRMATGSAAARSAIEKIPIAPQTLGLKSYDTAWAWMHKLRRAMVRTDRETLSGLVEVDKSLIGGVHPGLSGVRPDKISVLSC